MNLVTFTLAIYSHDIHTLSTAVAALLDIRTCDHVVTSHYRGACTLNVQLTTIRRAIVRSPQMSAMLADLRLFDTIPTVSQAADADSDRIPPIVAIISRAATA
jgi:hypothetical protein